MIRIGDVDIAETVQGHSLWCGELRTSSAGPLSPDWLPLPAAVVITPWGETLRMRLLP